MPALTVARPSEAQVALGAALGFVTQLLFDTKRKSFSIAAIAAQVVPAIQLRQIEFCYDENGTPVAYATWAFLSDSVSMELYANDQRLLHLTEWNEGANLWVMDIVAPYGHLHAFVGQLKRGRFADAERIRAIRRGSDGKKRRIVDFHGRQSCRSVPKDLAEDGAVATR